MKIYGLEKMSMVDFDGHICCVVFTAGCNFKCPYCHNSDLVLGRHLMEFNEDEFFAFLKKRKGLLDGVCVSGGEPTLQPDLEDFIRRVKAMGYLVKLDTNGTNPAILKHLIDENLLDYVAMDIKNSKTSYLKTSGQGHFKISDIEESVKLLKSNIVPYEFRTTLTKEHHTGKDIEDMAVWLDGSDKLFLQCFVDNGTCIQPNLQKIDKNIAEKYQKILKNHIKNVFLRGY